MSEQTRPVLDRREFLRVTALAAGAVGLAACAQTPPTAPSAPASPQVTRAPEPTKAAAPAAAPAAPSAPASPQVTKAPAAATQAPAAPTQAPAAATQAPTAAKAEAPRIGRHLIGKMEGPETITDPAKYPKTLKEAPALAELVKAGKLPPVQERIGQDPLVIKPVHEIGKYGGVMRRGFTGPADYWNGLRIASGPDKMLYADYSGTKVVPNVARGWEVSDDGLTTTLFLRRGMKWSDGQPFTADDFLYWYQDVMQNKELLPIPPVEVQIKGQLGTIEKVDAYTVRWRFPEPYFMFPNVVAGVANTSLAEAGWLFLGFYHPAHYSKQFHPKYVAKEELDKKVKDAKMDNWVSLYKFKHTWWLNPELPTLSPWVTVSPNNTPAWTFERNPYSIWVDTEGNQLPYIDKISMTLAENLEVVNLRAIAGEYDKQSRHLDIQKLPLFVENQTRGNYKLYLDPVVNGTDTQLMINNSYEADPEAAKWLSNADFRRALSLGVNRDQLNETFWLGMGTPGSAVPAEDTLYNPGPEYRTRWATYDPKKANEMLDKIGLDKKDGEGYRLRTDGKGRLDIEILTPAAQFLPWAQHAEMVAEHWQKIGVRAHVVEVERSLFIKRCEANEPQITVWSNEGSEEPFLSPSFALPINWSGTPGTLGTLFAKWFSSGGKAGKEPPPRLRRAQEIWGMAKGVRAEERVKLGKELWTILAEDVYGIGTVGLSPAQAGIRIAKGNMGNVPARQLNSNAYKAPTPSLPQTFYWKS